MKRARDESDSKKSSPEDCIKRLNEFLASEQVRKRNTFVCSGVIASPLQMASVAQTIASRGMRHPPFIVHNPRAAKDRQDPVRVVGRGVAGEVTQMMEAVVSYGTGTSAAISGITVAGKTGTAEVGPGRPSDAWFIAFAPAEAPRVAVAVLIVNGGVGGDVAAPIAREVLAAALGG